MTKRFQSKEYRPHNANSSAGGDGAFVGPPVVMLYQSSEAAPLLPGKTRRLRVSMSRACRIVGWCLLALIFSLMLHRTYMHRNCPPDPDERAAIIREWEREKQVHETSQSEWKDKAREQAEKEAKWKHDADQHKKDVNERKREEYERQKKIREEWSHEIERHVREFEELLSREKRHRELERERWRREVEERDRREEEERLRRNMFWGHVEAHTCTTFATREYTAQLINLPIDWEHRLDACKATPLEIHGVSYPPTSCEDRGPGAVIGRWEVNQQEPDCTTFWDSYHDKGCSSPGSGKKFITHKLMNLPQNADWREFCATTPAHFNHMEFPGAQECFTTLWGVYGQWEIDDSSC